MKEKNFPKYIKKKGFDCLRFSKRYKKQIKNKLGFWPIFENKGKPDFFIFNKKRYYFCEFKSKNDNLSSYQLDWFINHVGFNYALALVCLNNERHHFKVEKKIVDEIIEIEDEYKPDPEVQRRFDILSSLIGEDFIGEIPEKEWSEFKSRVGVEYEI